MMKGEKVAKGSKSSFYNRRKGFFSGKNSVSFIPGQQGNRSFMPIKATMRHNQAALGKVKYGMQEAALRTATENGVVSTSALQSFKSSAEKISNTAVTRMKMAKYLRAGAIAYYGTPMVLNAALGLWKGTAETLTRTAATMGKLTAQEFGDWEIVDNSKANSERQRAVQAIQNANMNARYLMGNEATLYH